MRTILYVNPSGEVSGAENSLLVLINALRDRYRILVACPCPGKFSEKCRELGIPVFPIPFANPKSSTLYSMLILRPIQTRRLTSAVEKIAAEQKADLIHSNSYLTGPASGIAARRLGIPIIWHIRDLRYGFKQKLLRRIVSRYADHVLVVSNAVKDTLGKRLSGKVQVVYNGVRVNPISDAEREKYRSELGVQAGEFLVGNAGVIMHWKGQDLFVQIAQQVLQEVPNARFAVVGPAWPQSLGFDQQVKSLAKELGIQDRIVFTGYRPDALSITASMDVYLHTARDPDPLPRSVLEAMATGVPVVAPAAGGIPEMFVHGESGMLYPPGDVTAAAEQVTCLLKDRDMAASIGKAACEQAQKCFSVEAHVEAVAEVYERLLA